MTKIFNTSIFSMLQVNINVINKAALATLG